MHTLRTVPIYSLTSEDLESAGFDVSLISQSEMRSLASDMADIYADERFLADLLYFGEEHGLPRLQEQ